LQSSVPKALQQVAGWPLVRHAYTTAREAGCSPIVVVGPRGVDLSVALDADAQVVEQPEGWYGTAFATAAAEDRVGVRAPTVVVVFGDSPLLRPETIRALAERRAATAAAIAVAWAQVDSAGSFGRVVRNAAGDIEAIVEAADATPAERALSTINTGLMAFDARWLWANLHAVPASPVSAERYLPALVPIARAQGRRVVGCEVADAAETIGCDDAAKLAAAEAVWQGRLRAQVLAQGVQLRDPATTYLHRGVAMAPDTVIMPNTSLEGATTVGRGSRLGPGTRLIDAQLGERCVVEASRIEGSRLGAGVTVGPYAHIRAACAIGDGCEIGSHAELKATILGAGVRVHHFSYLGDTEVGEGANIGAGTVTCNFDGIAKHRTVIGKRAFVGSDTLLVAPVSLGDGAATGAGSVVTHDVAAGALVYGAPARVRRRRADQQGGA